MRPYSGRNARQPLPDFVFHVALADDVRRQCLLRAHLSILKELGVVAFDVLAKELVVLGVMTRNVIIYNEFEFLKLEQVLHRELERGGSVAASGVVLHRTDSRFQRLHRLDNGVYHQLRTLKITAKDVKPPNDVPAIAKTSFSFAKSLIFLMEAAA